MKVGIFGLPNSGKSSFRRWLVVELRKAGYKAEHWDVDGLKDGAPPEDADMREPPKNPDEKTIWLVEDVRGTVWPPASSWWPFNYYDFIFYLQPLWPTYAFFWASRALQWQKNGVGDWKRETGWEDMSSEAAIQGRLWHYLSHYEKWLQQDMLVFYGERLPYASMHITPTWDGSKIVWGVGFKLLESYILNNCTLPLP